MIEESDALVMRAPRLSEAVWSADRVKQESGEQMTEEDSDEDVLAKTKRRDVKITRAVV